MGFLSLFEGTVIIDAVTGKVVEGGEKPEWWVEVKKTLEQGVYETAQRFLIGDMGVESRADAPEDAMMKQKTDLVGYQRELVFAALEDWNLTDKDDQRLPISNLEDRRRSIAKLPPATHTAIYAVVAKLNQPRDEKEVATFPDRDDAGSKERGETDAVVAPVRDRSKLLEAAGA